MRENQPPEPESDAAQRIYDRYAARLVAMIRARLSRRLAQRVDAEDVSQSAWRSFFVARSEGRGGVGEDDVWGILATIALRKVARQARFHSRNKRDLRKDESIETANAIAHLRDCDPTAEEATEGAEEIERALEKLAEVDREIVEQRLRGEDVDRIAASINCSPRSVRRAVARFREMFGVESAPTQNTHEESLVPTVDYSEVTLQKMVGEGALGKVFLGTLVGSAEPVAVKFLKKTLWKSHRAMRTLLREWTVASQLNHPGVVRHHGWGMTAGGACFLVMEHIDGENLTRRVGNFSPVEVQELAGEVAGILEHTHRAGIVHGDLTPANVMMRHNGTVVLTDFGFANLAGAGSQIAGGTPGFLAPEQISDAFGPVDARTDCYGLGALMYALLTGRAPYVGRTPADVIASVLSTTPPESIRLLCPECPEAVADLIHRFLSTERFDRPPLTALGAVGESRGSVR